MAYLFIRMANSPRPGLWTLEKSSDYGKTWKPWQHFSDTPADCETFFGRDSLKPITADDDVICTTEYSKIVPLENGEIPVTLLNNRPSAKNYFNSTVLQEWTRATNVRFRFYRTKNLLGHLMSVARQDPTVTRRVSWSLNVQRDNDLYYELLFLFSSISIPSRIFPLAAVVCVTAMRILATS